MGLRTIKIVVDSSAGVLKGITVPHGSAPLKIITSQREYVDDETLDVEEMVNDLAGYSGKSSTACPSPGDWLEAFGEAEDVICIPITSMLSGSYYSACIARRTYEEEHPGRRVHVLDSLSTGPEVRLLAEHVQEDILEGLDFDALCASVSQYRRTTGLFFMLESMKNLANNGRVHPLAAKAAGLLGIRVVGQASEGGELELLDKCRGERKALASILEHMKQRGYSGGKVRISHCFNETAALTLKARIQEDFFKAPVEISPCRGLCSFYAERGGLLVGFEGRNPQNLRNATAG